MDILQLIIFIRELNVESLCKSVTEIMARTGLKSFAVVHKSLDRIGGFSTGEFFLIRLPSADDRDSEEILKEIRVKIQHLLCPLLRFLSGRMGSMAFLPQELAGTEERAGRLLPANYRTPLIVELRKITVRLDILIIEITEKCLGCRAYTHALLQFVQTAVCDPCDFRCEPFNVILFLLKKAFRNEHRQVDIFNACFLKSAVKFCSDVFPDCIACRLKYHAAFYRCISGEFRLLDDIRIPLGKIYFPGCD